MSCYTINYILSKINYKEFFGNKQKNAICLLIKKSNDIWFSFLNDFTKDNINNLINYDIYIVTDDDDILINDYQLKYPNIKLLQINNIDAFNKGYKNSSYIKNVLPLDKALYYFCETNIYYDNIWFIEDDVYIPTKYNLYDLDLKYSIIDLIHTDSNINTDGNLNNWPWWIKIIPFYELPWYSGLQCICRMSNKLLLKIKEFVKINNTLVFLEVLFPTIAGKNNLKMMDIPEFKNVIYYQHYNNINEIDETNFYHPIKNLNHHVELRMKLI